MYKALENSGLIVPVSITPSKEFWRVMSKNSGQIVCVYKIDPDLTLHPAGTPWDVNGAHKGLPFEKGCGIHSLDEVTRKEREDLEIARVANERRPEKEKKRAEKKEEEERVKEFNATPVGERTAHFIQQPEEKIETTKTPTKKLHWKTIEKMKREGTL